MKQVDLFILFEKNSPGSIFGKKKNFLVILCFFLKIEYGFIFRIHFRFNLYMKSY